MNIYKIYKGKIHSLEVRETEHKYIAEDKTNEAFDFGHHFYKQDCDRTQGKAIKRALDQARAKRMKIEADLIQVNTELKAIEHLERKFKVFLKKKRAAKKGKK